MHLSDAKPVWERPDLVRLALAREVPTPEDGSSGIHDLRAGNHEVLSACAKLIHQSAKERCGFTEPNEWDAQLPLLEYLVERFFRDGDAAFGGFEIMKERRKATSRQTPGSGATLTQAPSQPKYLAPVHQLRSSTVDIGGILEIPGRLLSFAYRDGRPRGGTQFTETKVPRVLKAGGTRVWSEWWYSLARPLDDDEALRSGGIPAQESHLAEGGVLRKTPIISLFRTAPGRFWSGTIVETVCFEVHPHTGTLVDIRGITQELGSAMTASPHAHDFLLKTLNKAT